MQYLSSHPDKGMRVIDQYLSERLQHLKGKNRMALIYEYKEWLMDSIECEDNIWSIPDLTDEGLCDFFKRAISRK